MEDLQQNNSESLESKQQSFKTPPKNKEAQMMALINEVVKENRESRLTSKVRKIEQQEQSKPHLEDDENTKSVFDDNSALGKSMTFNSVQQLTTVQINRII